MDIVGERRTLIMAKTLVKFDINPIQIKKPSNER